MFRPRVLLVTLAALVAAGCGSSHHTSSTPVTPGTYRGTANITVSGGGQSLTRSGPVVITVSPDQVVTVGSFGSVRLSGHHFTLTTPASQLNTSTLSCPVGTITNEGTFNTADVDGTASSTGVVCNGLPLAFASNFHATLEASESRLGQGEADLLDVVRAAVKQAVGAR
jgi:hypothetical protein